MKKTFTLFALTIALAITSSTLVSAQNYYGGTNGYVRGSVGSYGAQGGASFSAGVQFGNSGYNGYNGGGRYDDRFNRSGYGRVEDERLVRDERMIGYDHRMMEREREAAAYRFQMERMRREQFLRDQARFSRDERRFINDRADRRCY